MSDFFQYDPTIDVTPENDLNMLLAGPDRKFFERNFNEASLGQAYRDTGYNPHSAGMRKMDKMNGPLNKMIEASPGSIPVLIERLVEDGKIDLQCEILSNSKEVIFFKDYGFSILRIFKDVYIDFAFGKLDGKIVVFQLGLPMDETQHQYTLEQFSQFLVGKVKNDYHLCFQSDELLDTNE